MEIILPPGHVLSPAQDCSLPASSRVPGFSYRVQSGLLMIRAALYCLHQGVIHGDYEDCLQNNNSDYYVYHFVLLI